MPVATQCVTHAKHVAEQLDVKDALKDLTELIEKEASESKGFADAVGHLCTVQALFRTMNPGKTSEDIISSRSARPAWRLRAWTWTCAAARRLPWT